MLFLLNKAIRSVNASTKQNLLKVFMKPYRNCLMLNIQGQIKGDILTTRNVWFLMQVIWQPCQKKAAVNLIDQLAQLGGPMKALAVWAFGLLWDILTWSCCHTEHAHADLCCLRTMNKSFLTMGLTNLSFSLAIFYVLFKWANTLKISIDQHLAIICYIMASLTGLVGLDRFNSG